MDVNIQQIKNRLLVKYGFFGTVVSNVEYIEDNLISTAATDGKTVYYNSKFLASLDFDQQCFVLAHEICHIAYDHIHRSEGKIPKLWNIVADAVINAQLIRDGLKPVENAVNISNATDYDVEELYEKLLKEEREVQKQSNSDSNDGNSKESDRENSNVGHDSHDPWKKAIEKRKESSSNKGDDFSEKGNDSSDNLSKQNDNELEKVIKEISKLGEKSGFDENRKQREENLRNLRKALLDEASKAGTREGYNSIVVNDIGSSKPLVDWRRLLREEANKDFDYSYQNPYLEDGIIRPSIEDIPYSETEIILDTSGSVSINLLKNFLRECKNVFQNSRIKVGCFDTKFYGFNEIRSFEDIENMPFIGGGGTDFEVCVNAFTNRTENKIIFTDGMATMPSKQLDAIWIVFGGKKISPKGGRVIYISDEDLKRLNNMEYNFLRGMRR